jgi:hypothetical protein
MEDTPRFERSHAEGLMYVRYKGNKVFSFFQDECIIKPVKWYDKDWVLIIYNKPHKRISAHVFLERLMEK